MILTETKPESVNHNYNIAVVKFDVKATHFTLKVLGLLTQYQNYIKKETIWKIKNL